MILNDFIANIMEEINRIPCIIQNEYVFQQKFYHFAEEIISKNNRYSMIKIASEIHLDVNFMNNKGRFDFLIFDTSCLECYIVELKCKTNKMNNVSLVPNFNITIGANKRYNAGQESIKNDINRINNFLSKKYGSYKFSDGCVVLLTDLTYYLQTYSNLNPQSVVNINNTNSSYIVIR